MANLRPGMQEIGEVMIALMQQGRRPGFGFGQRKLSPYMPPSGSEDHERKGCDGAGSSRGLPRGELGPGSFLCSESGGS